MTRILERARRHWQPTAERTCQQEPLFSKGVHLLRAFPISSRCVVGVIFQCRAFDNSHWVLFSVELYLELDGKWQIDVAAFAQKQHDREALRKVARHLVFF